MRFLFKAALVAGLVWWLFMAFSDIVHNAGAI